MHRWRPVRHAHAGEGPSGREGLRSPADPTRTANSDAGHAAQPPSSAAALVGGRDGLTPDRLDIRRPGVGRPRLLHAGVVGPPVTEPIRSPTGR